MWILWLIGTQIGVPVGFLHRVDNNVFQVIITHSFVGKRRIKNGKVYLVLTIICYSKFRKTSDKIYKNRAWKIRLSKPMYIKKALLTTTYFGVVWTSIDLGQIGQFTSVFRWFWYQYYRASYRNIFRFIYRSDDILSEKFIKLMRQNFLCYDYIRDWQKKYLQSNYFQRKSWTGTCYHLEIQRSPLIDQTQLYLHIPLGLSQVNWGVVNVLSMSLKWAIIDPILTNTG